MHLYVQAAGRATSATSTSSAGCRTAPRHLWLPATGSANVALIGLLAALRPEPDLRLEKTIAQGVDMGRPKRLEARAEKTAGTVTATFIGGTCVR